METNEEIVIYYFSATGNSLKAASVIASRHKKAKLIKIDGKKVIEHQESAIVGFIFPVYMGIIPVIVSDYLKRFPFKNNVYYFSVATYYKYKGIALSLVDKIAKERDAKLSYGNYIPTVGNCLKEYEVSEKKRPAILKRADLITDAVATDIKNRINRQLPISCSISEKLHNSLFNILFKNTYKEFTIEDNCIGCGICSKLCPVGNIVIIDHKPQWGIACASCHACVHWCPKNAINVGRSKGRLQYHNPDIKLIDLLQ